MNYLIKPAHAATDSIGAQFDLAFPTFGAFVKIITPLAFSIATIMVTFYFLIGALELITSQGDKGHIVSARSKIYHSIIGFILLIVIFLLMQYIPTALGLKDFVLF